MSAFINYCIEYKWYVLAFVVFLIALVFVLKKTAAAYKRYYSSYRAEEERMKRLVNLKERFADLTEAVIANENEDELLEGVALSYQLKLQKLDNMEEEFSKYNDEKKYIYCLDIMAQSESLSMFFRENGPELKDISVDAFEYIGLTDNISDMKKLQIMFDENDDTTSINQAFIDKMDKYAADVNLFAQIKEKSAKKIKEDAQKFLFNKN